jgi:HEAT repeat protein
MGRDFAVPRRPRAASEGWPPMHDATIDQLLSDACREGSANAPARVLALRALPPLLLGTRESADVAAQTEDVLAALVTNDPDANVRRLATAALAATPARSSIAARALLAALRDISAAVRREAPASLARLALDSEAADTVVSPTRVVAALVNSAIGDADAGVRAAAAEALAELTSSHDAVAFPALESLFNDANDDVRLAALAAFDVEHAPVATLCTTQLVKSLDDPNPAIRAAVLRVMHRIGPRVSSEQVVEHLARLVNADADVRVRRNAAAVLGVLQNDSTVATTALRAATRDADPGVRRVAIEALALILQAKRRWVPYVLQICVARRAAGLPSADEALAVLDVPVRAVAEFFTKCVTDADEVVRWNAALGLATCGADAAVALRAVAPMLNAALASERVAAVVAFLGPGPAGTPWAPAIAERLLHDHAVIVRKVAAMALGGMGPAAAPVVESVRQSAEQDPRDDVRTAAAQALAKIENPPANPQPR